MIKIEAIIREEKYEDVKAALNDIDVHEITVSQVIGSGVQKGYNGIVRGSKVDVNMLPKIKFEILVPTQASADDTVEAIRKAALTWNYGDGKTFVYDFRDTIRSRTGQHGDEAIHHEQKVF